jgi:hypothetical protein
MGKALLEENCQYHTQKIRTVSFGEIRSDFLTYGLPRPLVADLVPAVFHGLGADLQLAIPMKAGVLFP